MKENSQTSISIPGAVRLVGVVSFVWAVLTVLTATLAYLPDHPGFSLFTTYLSDIGDAPGWPQILFNSGTLIAVPMRYLVIVLFVLRLAQLGAGRPFAVSVLIVGLIATLGTAIMTAVPFSVAPVVHKLGIPMYFLGVVVSQTVIAIKGWSLPGVPKVLGVLSLLMVVTFVVFATLFILLEQGIVGRSTPVIWEWLCFFSSIAWLLGQSILLGRETKK